MSDKSEECIDPKTLKATGNCDDPPPVMPERSYIFSSDIPTIPDGMNPYDSRLLALAEEWRLARTSGTPANVRDATLRNDVERLIAHLRS